MEFKRGAVKCIWNIFLPRRILHEPPGLLVGSLCPKMHQTYINGILHRNVEKENEDISIIGDWQPESAISEKSEGNYWLSILCHNSEIETVQCQLVIKEKFKDISFSAVCIIYDPENFLASYILSSPKHSLQSLKVFLNKDVAPNLDTGECSEDGIFCLPSTPDGQDFVKPLLVVSAVADSLLHVLNSEIYTKMNSKIRLFVKKAPRKALQRGFHTVTTLPWILMIILMYLCKAIDNSVEFSRGFVNAAYDSSNTLRHLRRQGKRSKNSLDLDRRIPLNQLMFYNACAVQLVDTGLGVGLICLIMYFGAANQTASIIMMWADEVAQELTTLVKWLMGSPAGLKLNAQLTKFLGHFFTYHIYLWTGYLSILESLLPGVIWYSSMLGVLGISHQLSFLQDVVSMLTLHIYCFYVYAARIFNLQVRMLSSLWRLFRGKKWNELRSRVDSAAYNTDQLFIGTLLFTVLLFLLPTTLLYYAVFTMLRLVVLFVQGVLTRIIAVITSTPIFTLLLRILFPSQVAGSVKFQVSTLSSDSKGLVLNMKTSQIPLSELKQLTAWLLSGKKETMYTWGQFLSHIATGTLLYPWINIVGKNTSNAEKVD